MSTHPTRIRAANGPRPACRTLAGWRCGGAAKRAIYVCRRASWLESFFARFAALRPCMPFGPHGRGVQTWYYEYTPVLWERAASSERIIASRFETPRLLAVSRTWRTSYNERPITSVPIYGRKASGTTTLPSFCW